MEDDQLLIAHVRLRFPALNVSSDPLRGQFIYRLSTAALAEIRPHASGNRQLLGLSGR